MDILEIDVCLIVGLVICCAIIFASIIRLWVKLTHVKFKSDVNIYEYEYERKSLFLILFLFVEGESGGEDDYHNRCEQWDR